MTDDNKASEVTKEFKKLKDEVAKAARSKNAVRPTASRPRPGATTSNRVRGQAAQRTSQPMRQGTPAAQAATTANAAAKANRTAKGQAAPGTKPSQPEQTKADQDGGKRKQKMPVWLLVILKTVRILLVPALCVLALYMGLRIGYGHFGEQNPEEIWDLQTWKHLYDLVFADN